MSCVSLDCFIDKKKIENGPIFWCIICNKIAVKNVLDMKGYTCGELCFKTKFDCKSDSEFKTNCIENKEITHIL